MVRKKIQSEADVIDGIPELEADEQFVIEDKKTIRKERVKQPEPTAEPVDFDFDDDGEDDEPQFPEDSIAAEIYGTGDEPFENSFCSIAVRRKPDSMKDRFLSPATSVLNYPALTNVEITTSKSEIEDIVRNLYGGGHYFFQIRHRDRLSKSWQASLADSPEAIKAAKAEVLGIQIPTVEKKTEPEPPKADPFDQFLDNLEKQQRMKNLMFGDEMAELQRLRRESAERSNASPEVRKSELLTLVDYAVKSDNPTLQEKLLSAAFPAGEEGEGGSHWITDLVKLGFEHKEEIGGVLQMLFGGQSQPAASLENLLRSQPPPSALNVPAATETPPPTPMRTSTFQRRKLETEPEAEPEIIDGEIDNGNDTTGNNSDAEAKANDND